MKTHRRTTTAHAATFGGVLLLLAATSVLSAPVDPALLTRAIRRSATGTGASFAPAFSGDGRYVIFHSQAKDLVTNGVPSVFLDLYVRDLLENKTILVSATPQGLGGGNGNSHAAAISREGRWIAFESDASNLVPNDSNGLADIFLRDLASGTTTALSRSSNATSTGNRTSRLPLISANGQFVAFESLASDLVTNDLNGTELDLFLADTRNGKSTLVTMNAEGTGSPQFLNSSSSSTRGSAALSADGRFVCYLTFAANVVVGVSNGGSKLIVRDIQANSNIWADVGLTNFIPGVSNALTTIDNLLSADGRFVAFEAIQTGTFRPAVTLRYDILTGSTRLISVLTNYSYPVLADLSEDGRFVLVNGPDGPFVVDAELGSEELVCPPGRFPGLNACQEAVLSADGSRVAFLGAASTNGPWSVYVSVRGQNTPVLVSITTNGTPAEVVPLLPPAFSRDGTKVAFESEASDLVPLDFNQAADIFVRDLATDSTVLVSARAESVAVGASLQPSMVFGPQCLSSDGRYLVFQSLRNELAPGAGSQWMNVFLRDNWSGTNALLPLLAPAGPGSVAGGIAPVLSLNGRYVAWLEPLLTNAAAGWAASNISWFDRETGAAKTVPLEVPQAGAPAMSQDGRWLALVTALPESSFRQVFVQDMWDPNATRQLLSVNRNGQPGAGHSSNPRFSPNGRWLLFDSQAHDLATNTPPPTPSHLYARNISTGTTRLLGDAWLPGVEDSQASNAVFSADSRYVVFLMPRPGGGFFVRQELEGPTNQVVLCTQCSQPSVNQDGRLVAFRMKNATTGYQDVFVWDAQTSNSVLITANVLPGPLNSGNGNSSAPQLAANGRYVCFASEAGNLVSHDSNGVADVFVHDRTLRRTFLISRRLGGAQSASAASTQPILGPDGRTIVFPSFASDLVADDFNNTRDLYLVQLGHGDSDTDGLDDDWEVAYFDTVARDGRGDFDADGATDFEEFRSGTDPTNHASVLQVLTVRSLQTNRKLILWASTPGRTYRVQFKRALNDPQWRDLPGTFVASDETASAEDLAAADEPERFYRVVLD